MIINLNNKSTDENVENIDIESLQKETMESMKDYIENLVPKLEGMVIELKNNIQEDSWEYLRMMIDGFNWVLEAYNGTSSFINADQSIDEKSMQETVDNLSDAFINQKADETANLIELGVIPFLKMIQSRL